MELREKLDKMMIMTEGLVKDEKGYCKIVDIILFCESYFRS